MPRLRLRTDPEEVQNGVGRIGERTREDAVERTRGFESDCERLGNGFANYPNIACGAQALPFNIG